MPGDVPPAKTRFRTACDPCSTAKVRCDKRHPVCNRCLHANVTCSYSESRKHGRQSWRKRMGYDRARSVAGIAVESQPLVKTRGITPNLISLDQTEWSPLMASLSAPLVSGKGAEPLLHNGQQGPGDASTLPSPWTLGGFSAEMDVDLLGNWDTSNLSPFTPQRGDALPVASGSTEKSSPALLASSTHDCEAHAVSILHSMQHGELQRGATSCSIHPAQYADLNLSPPFDRVLATTKAALDGWSKLMRCSCAQCPHLILLYVSILSKMIFWYRIAATERISPPEEDENSAGSPGNKGNTAGSWSPEEAPTVDQFSVRPTPIEAGALSLSDEDQAGLRRELLLRGLRRTEKAVDELLSVDRTAVDRGVDEVLFRAVQWSAGGISNVREQLQDVIRKVEQLR